MLAGCSSDQGRGTDLKEDFQVEVTQAIADATDAGASAQQLDILERAATDGGVTFEDAKIASVAFTRCMTDLGFDATYQEQSLPNGLVIPGYTVSDPDGGGSATIDRCDQLEAYWVNMLYQTQPTSIEANLAYIEKQAPVIRQCLEKAGYDTDPDATGMELVLQATDVAQQTGLRVDCLGEAGVVSY